MPVIRSANDIILSMIDLLRILQPNLDTKNGTVARDLFVEMPSSEIALLYDELSNLSDLQSIRLAAGADLDRLASNYGIVRKNSTKATGVALVTFKSIPAVISINSGDIITASNGFTFSVINGISVSPTNTNIYRSLATKYKNDLDFLGITDQYAAEVTVQCTAPGSFGNLSKYSLNQTNISGVSNVTNVSPFSRGTDQEDDPSLRNRVLAIFSGSSNGTTLGYKNVALSNENVIDALVIEPGDPLMTRDGTIVVKNSDGTFTIISEGSGGKVDIVILGETLSEYTDSFIYNDKSNNNDPTDSKNDFVLGQITGDENKTISRKRIDNIANGVLPAQPVSNLLEITGSLSGSNFIPKSIDSLGRVSGNYELVKDTGFFGGSPFGFDKIKWVSDKISDFEEDKVKAQFNGQDVLNFPDSINISSIEQNLLIVNENSLVSSDRSVIQLLHTPSTNITRVVNVNTGERYTVTNQNLDGSGDVNYTGRIKISGNNLPSVSDVLQVDYTWIFSYDPYVDYDGKFISSNIREVGDNIDWGLSNAVKSEKILFTKNNDGTLFIGSVSHPISSIASCNLYSQADGEVFLVSSGNFAGRLAVSLNGLISEASNIESIVVKNTNFDIFNTLDSDSTILNQRLVVGPEIRYNATIILPSDSPAEVGQPVTAFYNFADVLTNGVSVGTFTVNQITIPSLNLSGIISDSVYLNVSYFSSIQDSVVSTISSFPISRSGNSFISNNISGFVNSAPSNIIKKENYIIQLNQSLSPCVVLNSSTNDMVVGKENILSIVRLSDGYELWNYENQGTISVSTESFYQLNFSGFNSPAVGQNVVVIYTNKDLTRCQPFTFSINTIKQNVQEVGFDPVRQKYYVELESYIPDTVDFEIFDPTNSQIDGYGTGTISSDGYGVLSSTFLFSTVDNLLFKKVRIKSSSFSINNGAYDIIGNDSLLNVIYFKNEFSALNSNQVSIIRLLDNKEIWSPSGEIDIINNKLYIPVNSSVNLQDLAYVIIFNSQNLRKAPSRLSINVNDQVNNSGIITVSGTTFSKVSDAIVTATSNGLKLSLSEAVKSDLKLSSVNQIPATISLSRLVKAEKVTTVGNEVVSVDAELDVFGFSIKNNIFYANESVDNDSLGNFEIIFPSTSNNNSNSLKIGEKVRVTFYYSNSDDYENINFTRNGTLFTNKLFAFINKVFVSSGFTSATARLTLSYMNQPATGTRYKAVYDYTAPKINERISVRYNYNRVISDTTFSIETNRPINADVLVREAKKVFVDVILNIVINSDLLNSSAIIQQNVKDTVINAININSLGTILDASDLVTSAQNVSGVDRARIIYFNKSGELGQVLSIIAQKDEYFVANSVIVNIETRNG